MVFLNQKKKKNLQLVSLSEEVAFIEPFMEDIEDIELCIEDMELCIEDMELCIEDIEDMDE